MSTEKPSISHILLSYEISITKIILYCLAELPIPLGVKRIIDILKGNRNSFAFNNELYKLQTFSALTGYTRDQLSDLFDTFILKGYLDVEMRIEDEEEIPVIALSASGRRYLAEDKPEAPNILDSLMDRDYPDIPENDQDLFYKLKLARRQLAEEYDYPAFMVCSDKVLKEMCLKKPVEPDVLLKIAGVDMAFMKHYSKQFLYVIRQYVTREKGS